MKSEAVQDVAMLLDGAAHSRHQKRYALRRYAVAVLCVLAAFGIRYWLSPIVGEELPFMMFIAAALVAAWYGGAVTGIVALMLGLLLANHFFIRNANAQSNSNALEAFRLIRYLFTASLGVVLIEVLHRGRRRTEAALEQAHHEVARRQRIEKELLDAQAQLRVHAAELESRVAERTAKLASAVQSLEGILHHIAHNLRAPLRAMAGYSTVLIAERSDTLDSTGKAYCQSICAAAQRMDTLVQDLLEFGGVGHVTLNLTKIKLQEILDDVLARVAQQIAATEADVKVIGPLPELCADARILERILEHLLDNALKFVATNNKPSITIRAETQHGSVRLWVDDHGIGIDPLYHKRIFGAFETLHPPGTFEGTGIGLAIVKQGMERMGGKAGVESESGKGSRFWLQFEKQPPKLISGDENSRS